MLKIKKLFIITIFTILIIMSAFSKSYAEFIPVTDENLAKALQELAEYNQDAGMEITIEDNNINIVSEGTKYTIKYDLTDKPKFIYATEMKKGMTYDDFKTKSEESTLTLLGYMAVAKIQEVEFETSGYYGLMCMLGSTLSKVEIANSDDSFIIVDDTQEGVTIDKESKDSKTIYVSEFGEHAMEYVNSVYKNNHIFNDAEQINSFEMVTEKKDVDETSCIIQTTLTINPEADFSKIESIVKESKEAVNQNENNEEDIETNENEEIKETSNAENNDEANLSTMPKAGKTNNPILISGYVLIALASMGIIGLIITRNKK